ncbi:peptidoglycan-binding protein [Frigidibacter sp. MR17.14]|uniref:peptidoglycan-binding domain-containing protein n=1 Tax=Frigidibacter sp. MR17.14 TaxID=3126509 RepID=UPI003012AE9A
MIGKRIATACLAGSIALTPATRVMADGGDAALGLIVGGLIGGAIVNENNKARQREAAAAAAQRQQYRRNSAAVSAQREQNREVQTALNYFGYPVGTPDGAFGPRTRAGIADMQATLGYPATGELTEYQRTLLVGSYHRGVASPQTMQLAAGNPMGMRGLLVAWRDEQMGVMPQQAMTLMPQPAMPAPMVAAPAATVMAALPEVAEPAPAPAPAPAPTPAPAPMAVAAPAPAAPGLPSFMGGDVTQASLASQCNKVSLMTSSNGGFVTAASLSDPNQALGEQFCLARTYAIAQGEELASQVQGFTPAQIAEQCRGFAPAMQAAISSIAIKPAPAVMTDVQAFAQGTGMSAAQLISTAKICLSVGYRTDDMGVAIASALLLTSMGDAPYAELVGHHLSQGFGTAQRPDLALGWYDVGLDALAAGVAPVFAPAQPERAELVRRAAYRLGGRAEPMPAPVPAALPSFGVPAPQAVPQTAPADPEKQSSVAPAPGAVTVSSTAAASAGGSPVAALPAALQLPFKLFRD